MEKLAALLDAMDVDPARVMSSKSGRIEMHKMVYLLQELGIDLGYNFGWYKHGVYSTTLAVDATHLGDAGWSDVELEDREVETCRAARRLAMQAFDVLKRRPYHHVLMLLTGFMYHLKNSTWDEVAKNLPSRLGIDPLDDLEEEGMKELLLGDTQEEIEGKNFFLIIDRSAGDGVYFYADSNDGWYRIKGFVPGSCIELVKEICKKWGEHCHETQE